MSSDSVGVVTGLAVLFAGVFAAVNLMGPPEEQHAQDLPQSVTSATVPASSAALVTTEPDLPGVGSAINRVLERSGNVRLASAEDLAQLPPSVSAVLVEYDVPLRLPTGPGETK
jgi:hypothetical protein